MGRSFSAAVTLHVTVSFSLSSLYGQISIINILNIARSNNNTNNANNTNDMINRNTQSRPGSAVPADGPARSRPGSAAGTGTGTNPSGRPKSGRGKPLVEEFSINSSSKIVTGLSSIQSLDVLKYFEKKYSEDESLHDRAESTAGDVTGSGDRKGNQSGRDGLGGQFNGSFASKYGVGGGDLGPFGAKKPEGAATPLGGKEKDIFGAVTYFTVTVAPEASAEEVRHQHSLNIRLSSPCSISPPIASS